MYADLIEHFSTVLVLLGVFGSIAVYFLVRLLNRFEAKIDELSNKLITIVERTVTKSECDSKHDTLLTVITAMLNCQNCNKIGRKKRE